MLYSTRNNPRPRDSEELSDKFVASVWSEFDRLVNSNAFAKFFSEDCRDGNDVAGTNKAALMGRIYAEIPDAPFNSDALGRILSNGHANLEDLSLVTWDIVEFTLKYVSSVRKDDYHSYHRHFHLSFNLEKGRQQYREFLNGLLATYGMAYKLNGDDQVIRVIPESVSRAFRAIDGLGKLDEELGVLLHQSQDLFLSRDFVDNKNALEKIWDAFERLKSLTATSKNDKKTSIERLILQMSEVDEFRTEVDDEMRKLTTIGNSFSVRHSEVYQTKLNSPKEVRYLYLRMLSFIYLATASSSIKTPSQQTFINDGKLPF